MTPRAGALIAVVALAGIPACGSGGDREDGAYLLSEDPRSLQNPCVSPDGDRAVVTAYHEGYDQGVADLVLVDLETGALDDLVADGAHNVNHAGHCWNSSNLVVYASDVEGEGFDLHALDPDTGDTTRLTDHPDRDATQATWTGGGAWIVFLSEDADGAVISRVRADGGGEIPVTDVGDVVTQPTASPIDDRIAYQHLVDGVWNLAIVDPGVSAPEELTDSSGDDLAPSWTWDGSRVVFSSDRDGQSEPDLYAVAIEGCEISQLLGNELFEGAPALTSDDGFVLFETADSSGDATDIWYIPSPGG